ncbi:unnamed protein product [Sphenostylis stenocarpa]|uniref:Protein kinase domain-containing protein n=1 Tax=Sphenostylis stenocarpa TaxID=92480 RepID=A0AA86SGM9_9FABA|nr:unnamed protein product [Sphenostylis stenocarpa]
MSNGSLDKHLPGGKLSWKKRVEICRGVARGLHYLHTGAKRSMFHCILRASTILLDGNMEPKLAVFGLSVHGPRFNPKPQPQQINVDHIIGVVGYMPLEYVMDGDLIDKVDE